MAVEVGFAAPIIWKDAASGDAAADLLGRGYLQLEVKRPRLPRFSNVGRMRWGQRMLHLTFGYDASGAFAPGGE